MYHCNDPDKIITLVLIKMIMLFVNKVTLLRTTQHTLFSFIMSLVSCCALMNVNVTDIMFNVIVAHRDQHPDKNIQYF